MVWDDINVVRIVVAWPELVPCVVTDVAGKVIVWLVAVVCVVVSCRGLVV